jgi:hypothetical protein
MSNYSDEEERWEDQAEQHEHQQLFIHKNAPVSSKNWFDTIFDPRIEQAVNSPIFKMIQAWVTAQTGVNIERLVWIIVMFIPLQKYSQLALDWTCENVSNSVSLDPREAVATDLLIWISRQPSSKIFDWLPSFEKLELTNLRDMNSSEDTDKDRSLALLASSGHSLFFFKGIPFMLHKPDGSDYSEKVTLRCLWGSAEPIKELLEIVRNEFQTEELILKVQNVYFDHTKSYTIKKRRLDTIDMDPLLEQELVSDLQEFFDPRLEDFY